MPFDTIAGLAAVLKVKGLVGLAAVAKLKIGAAGKSCRGDPSNGRVCTGAEDGFPCAAKQKADVLGVVRGRNGW